MIYSDCYPHCGEIQLTWFSNQIHLAWTLKDIAFFSMINILFCEMYLDFLDIQTFPTQTL